VRLQPEDPAEEYKTEPHPRISGALMLAHKPNGECWYLNAGGCSIHGRAPSLCRNADCRSVALRIDFEYAIKLHQLGKLDFRVWDRGRQLLKAITLRSRQTSMQQR
jgi:hypothetical protein